MILHEGKLFRNVAQTNPIINLAGNSFLRTWILQTKRWYLACFELPDWNTFWASWALVSDNTTNTSTHTRTHTHTLLVPEQYVLGCMYMLRIFTYICVHVDAHLHATMYLCMTSRVIHTHMYIYTQPNAWIHTHTKYIQRKITCNRDKCFMLLTLRSNCL
jgi:hypothetical protein